MSPYLMMMANAPVSFKAEFQTLTAMSTMEAQLVAAALAMEGIVLCSNMMTGLGFEAGLKTSPLCIDNTSALFVIGNRT